MRSVGNFRVFSPQVSALRAKLAASEEALAASARTREEDLQRTAAFWISKVEDAEVAADSELTAEVAESGRRPSGAAS